MRTSVDRWLVARRGCSFCSAPGTGVSADLLADDGSQRINFDLEGHGFSYVLTGFTAINLAGGWCTRIRNLMSLLSLCTLQEQFEL